MDDEFSSLSSKTSFVTCSNDDFVSIKSSAKSTSLQSFQTISSSTSKSGSKDKTTGNRTGIRQVESEYKTIATATTKSERTIPCKVNMDSLLKLKDSTRTLLCLLEDIQSKTHNMTKEDNQRKYPSLRKLPIETTSFQRKAPETVNEIINSVNMNSLQQKTKHLEEIYIKTEADDCSIFKRLTRQCHCLNNDKYNNFVIHFNENTKYFTSTLGEVIKNIRILKKFLYIGYTYTNDALTFLVEGLTSCPHNEKVEIAQACAHADICNVFDEQSIVIFCILYPSRKENCGDVNTQNLAAKLLYTLSQIEEGRRYLNFSSKIINDIRKVLNKNEKKLSDTTIEYLNLTLDLLNPPLTKHINVTYYCKAEQGIGYRTLIALNKYHHHMTTEEIAINLDLLQNLSEHKGGKRELIQNLPSIITAFRQLIIEYDDTNINGQITNILNNLFTKSEVNPKESELIKTYTVCNTTTEPIPVRSAINQVPSPRCYKKGNKLKFTPPKFIMARNHKGATVKSPNTSRRNLVNDPTDTKTLQINDADKKRGLNASQKYDYSATMRKLNLSRKL